MADTHSFEVVVARRVSYTPWWAPLGKRFEGAISMIPTHRDTRSGRRNALQVRGALLVGGILTVVFWESPWAPIGLFACAAALVMPMSVSKRRELIARLRAGRKKQTRLERVPGELVVEEKHVTLTVHGERVRRLRRAELEVDVEGERLRLTAGKKKADQLLVTPDRARPELDVWVETDDTSLIAHALSD